MSARPRRRMGLLASVMWFGITEALLTVLVAWLMVQFKWSAPADARAVWASAWLAVGVQVLTFAIARVVVRENVMAGWGLGVLVRFASVAMWAFLGVKALGLVPGPALLSLVVFFFVSTLVEPLFLNA